MLSPSPNKQVILSAVAPMLGQDKPSRTYTHFWLKIFEDTASHQVTALNDDEQQCCVLEHTQFMRTKQLNLYS
jgi:hypothetical protein